MVYVLLLIAFLILGAIVGSFVWACVWTVGFLLVCLSLVAPKRGDNELVKVMAKGIIGLLIILAISAGSHIRTWMKQNTEQAEIQRVADEVVRKENLVREYAEREQPEKWRAYVLEKKKLEISKQWQTALERGDIPESDHFRKIAKDALSHGMSKGKFIDNAKIGVSNAFKRCSTNTGDLLDELVNLHSEYIKRKEETEKNVAREKKASEDKEQRREELLRDFALKEAPQMWKTYQSLGSEVETLNTKLEELRNTLQSFGIEPVKDKDFTELASMRDAMAESRRSLHEKIKEAYLQFCKFAATSGSAELGELRRKALDEGIRAAESAAKRFGEMMKDK